VRNKLEDYMVNRPCTVCEGTRLQPVALAVTIDDCNISQVTRQPVVNILP
jgi:excinuclease ABC subunit A